MSNCDSERFVNRKKELTMIQDRVSSLARGDPYEPKERVFHLVGPSGIGKSCLLERCQEVLSKDLKCIPILLKLEKIKKVENELVFSVFELFHGEFCKRQNVVPVKKNKDFTKYRDRVFQHIQKHNNGCVIILLLDEINVPPREDLRKIEAHLLEKLLHNKRVLLVTAGRRLAGVDHYSLRPKPDNILLLTEFDTIKTAEQLEKLKPGSKHLAEQIHDFGGGIPGNSAKSLEYAVGAPLSISNGLSVVQALLEEVKREVAPHLYPILEAICVLSSFMPEDVEPLLKSHPLLEKEWSDRKVKEMFLELNKVHFGPGGLVNWDSTEKSWVLDSRARGLFEKELQLRDLELWRKLHCVAYKTYREWGYQYNSNHYKNKAEHHLLHLKANGYDCSDIESEG